MFFDRKRLMFISILLVFLAGTAPLIMYWFLIERIPTITVHSASTMFNEKNDDVMLIDVRSHDEFETNHIERSVNWPLDQISLLNSGNEIPERFSGKILLLICNTGIKSAVGVRKLIELSVPEIYNVRGGIQTWYANENSSNSFTFEPSLITDGESKQRLFDAYIDSAEGGVAIAAYMTKLVYMVLSFVLILVLWNRKATDLVALFWSMGFFFVGETICLVNYLFFNDQSILAEYLHSFGMVVSIGVFTFALFEGLDRRVIKFSDPKSKCAFIGLCRSCSKNKQVSCAIDRLITMAILAMIVISFIPLTYVPFTPDLKSSGRGLFFNYGASVIHQSYEVRYCPIIAIALFSIALLALLLKKDGYIHVSKIFFALGVGHMGFGLLRLALRMIYTKDIAWFTFWEEMTELVFIASVGIFLWIFRERLFKPITEKRSATK